MPPYTLGGHFTFLHRGILFHVEANFVKLPLEGSFGAVFYIYIYQYIGLFLGNGFVDLSPPEVNVGGTFYEMANWEPVLGDTSWNKSKTDWGCSKFLYTGILVHF